MVSGAWVLVTVINLNKQYGCSGGTGWCRGQGTDLDGQGIEDPCKLLCHGSASGNELVVFARRRLTLVKSSWQHLW